MICMYSNTSSKAHKTHEDNEANSSYQKMQQMKAEYAAGASFWVHLMVTLWVLPFLLESGFAAARSLETVLVVG